MRWRALALVVVALSWAARAGATDREEEQGLAEASAQAAEAIEEGGGLYREPSVEAYLERVLRRTLGAAAQGHAFRVRVLDSAAMNAASTPDGSIYVSVSLLASMGDEAELAALLGHEAAHILRHHAVFARQALRRAGVITVATLGLGLLPAAGGVADHSREEEREADADAIDDLARAGYDPAAAISLEELLAAATGPEQRSWLASHPSQAERIAAARAAVARLPPGGERGAERFSVPIAPLRLRAALIELASLRFDEAEREGQAAAAAAPSAAAWARLGDVSRLGKGDLATAADRYRKAIALDAACIAAYRGLGLALLRTGDRAEASAALHRYLQLSPGAPDRPFIEADLRALGRAMP